MGKSGHCSVWQKASEELKRSVPAIIRARRLNDQPGSEP
ncbi:hypothetical protein CLH62_08375 [Marinobacter guineae]|uniref:Insulin-like growth factor II E-peptide C-terminal domain-containing protein n=1 Tax=Marinobacter guineae TaxID=432303 RepID=A0A2G1VGW2_9GAMM|nr:hypothetical protein CLH62_08375 [Marinobacter guineae]